MLTKLRGGTAELRVETGRWTKEGGENLQAVYQWVGGGQDALCFAL